VRLGVFGGTFNPVHIGHLRAAEEVAEKFELDRVLFVPSANPPHKTVRGLAPAAHRLAMVRLAIAGNPRFRASDLELRRKGRSYSVDTLRTLRERIGQRADLYFILGVDAFRDIHTWHQYEQLFWLAHFVVISRPPQEAQPRKSLLPVAVRARFCYRRSERGLVNDGGYRIHFQDVTALDISSSDIRARAARGASLRYLVPPSVCQYIARHRLYGSGAHLN